MSESKPENTQGAKPAWFRWIKPLRVVIAVLVAVAVIYTAFKAERQLRESEFDLLRVGFGWWLGALGVYLVTMTMSFLFWHRVLIAFGQRPDRVQAMLAFFASQLGKYIPGKAMVVVIRTDMIRGEGVRAAPAAASVFVETLTWLFVGAAIASLLLIFQFQDQIVLQIAAGALTLIAGVLTAPAIFRRIAQRLGAGRGQDGGDLFAGLNLSTMVYGWCVIALGWCLNGLSLWMVLRGLPDNDVALSDYPLTLAVVTLATVAGFVSLLPGGIGVRELVMIPFLGARFGPVTAVVGAVVIRVVWLSAELLSSAIIYFYRNLNRNQ